jgi:hypothetical protein
MSLSSFYLFITKRGVVMLDSITSVILAVILGSLAAIVYALRILVLLERRIARIDGHIELIVQKVIKEELRIEQEEKKIEKLVKSNRKSKKR